MIEKERIVWLDLARGISMLFIVGYWHLRDYLGKSYIGSVDFNNHSLLVKSCLALFMFISGLFLAKYKFDNGLSDFKRFYQKRFSRFWILYAFSAISLYLGGLNPSFWCLITTLTGTSSYILPQPMTLWFFSMIMSFYVVTPFLNMVGMLICLCAALLAQYFISQGIDTRFFYCFPMYCFGLIMGRHDKITSLTNNKIGIPILLATITIMFFDISSSIVADFLFILPMLSILYASKLLYKVFSMRFIKILSYTSMCAYLFHRHIYMCILWFFKKCGYTDFPYYILVFMIPIVIGLSYCIQRIYDISIGMLSNKNN